MPRASLSANIIFLCHRTGIAQAPVVVKKKSVEHIVVAEGGGGGKPVIDCA